ncbi:unnamed protein product [Pseudo-nitzschia multistriata]|uniref:EDRF1 TPR repeats region domain-containing protein n=1 Tax=Pseudo-nitzschia multistriata TaxID=183589 RepID=A0A448ZQG1_9STRA|nr:unnamed protein product [Pseudo-nitzschia multistriata]
MSSDSNSASVRVDGKGDTIEASTRSQEKEPLANSVSSLSVVSAPPIAAVTTTGQSPTHIPSYSFSNNAGKNPNEASSLDFIGNSSAVKKLFSMSIDAAMGPGALTANQSKKRKPSLLAVHNFNGTLILDDAEDESNYEVYSERNHTGGGANPAATETSENTFLPPSSRSLALALSPASAGEDAAEQQDYREQSDALSLLSNIVGPSSALTTMKESVRPVRHESVESSETETALLAPPKPPREYIRWKFQDMNLLLGHDALIVRPTPGTGTAHRGGSSTQGAMSGITVRVEDAEFLRDLFDAFQRQQKNFLDNSKNQLSYAQALLQKGEPEPVSSTVEITNTNGNDFDRGAFDAKEDGGIQEQFSSTRMHVDASHSSGFNPPETGKGEETHESKKKSNESFSEVPLQTCIVPFSGPLGGRLSPQNSPITGPSVDASTKSPPPSVASTFGNSSPAISIVLDAYLDNLMANVPQLALCLQEKGLVQSIKLLPTEEIPSKMFHPSTLDTSRPVDFLASSNSSRLGKTNVQSSTSSHPLPQEEEFFSPQIMEMNASALLRFLKTHCTQNNSTYLLRREWPATEENPGGGSGDEGGSSSQPLQNIHLYDISAISTQKQKKWIWWLATMSYRFALRLRHLESSSTSSSSQSPAHVGLSESQKRAIRDRQRSLFQQTLDLLQDLMDIDGNAHESMVASVREHMADTYLSSAAVGGDDDLDENSPVYRETKGKRSSMHSSTPATSEFSPSPPVVTMAASSKASSETSPSSSILPSNSMTRSRSSEYLPRAIPSPSNHDDRQHQPYASISIDKLNKAQDHLVRGIDTLTAVFEKDLERRRLQKEIEAQKQEAIRKRSRRRQRQQHKNVQEATSLGNNYEENADEELKTVSPAMSMQLFGMNFKLVNISLRLAEHHLRNYYSSSAMQALRTAARRLKDAAHLLDFYKMETEKNIDGSGEDKLDDKTQQEPLQLQYIWLLEHCGHFARSFASDELWRDRGHASGEDVISVLNDVENAFVENDGIFGAKRRENQFWRMVQLDVLLKTSKGRISLQSLSGVVAPPNVGSKQAEEAIVRAESVLQKERVIRRERRKVLVASCVSYSRAITAFEFIMPSDPAYDKMVLLNLLQQRLGDACNETGKVLLAALRELLVINQGGKKNDGSQLAAEALLCSAEFWFTQGLDAFEACGDTRNLALLRCNLCQSYKLRANSGFSKGDASSSSKHAEDCLQNAADQLLTAHIDLGERDVDPQTWDMVSEELAATFLVLGVRRRQSLLGSGNAPVIFQVMRLSPGQERSIVDPMERALKIYEQSDNSHQAAAVHYQLALTYSKLWTCQLNESNTRKKLSKAFEHYSSAFVYFSNHSQGNEPTFCLLCLDLASLYAAIPGEEGIIKSLGCCLDCCDTFSMEAIKASTALASSTAKSKADWYEKMETIAKSVDDRVFKLLKSLYKIDSVRYNDLYREGLTAKMVRSVPEDDELDMNPKSAALLALHNVLLVIKKSYGILVSKQ